MAGGQTEKAEGEYTLQHIHYLKNQHYKTLPRKQNMFASGVLMCTLVVSHNFLKSLRLPERDSKFSRFNYLKTNIHVYIYLSSSS